MHNCKFSRARFVRNKTKSETRHHYRPMRIIEFERASVFFTHPVEANLNSQKHSNAHLTTIVSFLKGHTLQYNLSQPTSTLSIETSNSFILQQKV